jgi:hypothetical protein
MVVLLRKLLDDRAAVSPAVPVAVQQPPERRWSTTAVRWFVVQADLAGRLVTTGQVASPRGWIAPADSLPGWTLGSLGFGVLMTVPTRRVTRTHRSTGRFSLTLSVCPGHRGRTVMPLDS